MLMRCTSNLFCATIASIFILSSTSIGITFASTRHLGEGEVVTRNNVFVDVTDAQRISASLSGKDVPIRHYLDDYAAGNTKPGSPVPEIYSGCDSEEYASRLSYGPNATGPRLAKLSALLLVMYGDKEVTNVAKKNSLLSAIRDELMGWMNAGFRKEGRLLTFSDYCSKRKIDPGTAKSLIALDIARFVPELVFTLDVLRLYNRLSEEDNAQVDRFFLHHISVLIEAANNHSAFNKLPCARYDNQTSMHLLAILSAATMLGERNVIAEVVGQAPGIMVTLPAQIDGAIYSAGDHPRDCFVGKEHDSGYRQIAEIAAGEIVDRYRNHQFQTFGYPLWSLTSLLQAFAIVRHRLPDAVKNKLQDSLDYYAYYFANFLENGFSAVPLETRSYPSYNQYAGKPVSRPDNASIEGADGIVAPFLMGKHFFPDDPQIDAVIQRVRHIGGPRAFRRVGPLFLKYVPFHDTSP
ncbi:hypothetical protein [Methylobacterium fujisawaense]